ncbi:MAG: T9SS type A sorting domain-containing protein [Saprospiraceae bacterium]|nr:T9SS type A sorting domain-containing protein [Saprospiraceae bacterium]
MRAFPPVAFLLVAVCAFAQAQQAPYALITDTLTRHYWAGSSQQAYALRVTADSLPDRIVFTPLRSMVLDEAGGGACHTDRSGWAFQNAEVLPDDTWIVRTQRGEPILLQTAAPVGASWVAFQRDTSITVSAQVVSIDTMTWLGQFDSVKTIVFDVATLEPVDVFLDTLQVTRTFGLARFGGLLKFPDVPAGYQSYEMAQHTLAGLDAAATGIRNLTRRAAFDFAAGDLLHVERVFLEFGFGDLISEKLTCLSRVEQGDTVTYQFKRQQRTETWMLTGATIKDIVDTITVSYTSDSTFDQLAGALIGDDAWVTYHYAGLFGDRQSKQIQGGSDFTYSAADSCWFEVIVNQCADYGSTYIEGLGGPYFDHSCNPPIVNYRELRYYKKGDEEWGEPFDFTVSTRALALDADLELYPNPAGTSVTVMIPEAAHGEISVWDLSGHLMYKVPVSGPFPSMDVSQLSEGIYIIHVLIGEHISTGRLVIAR